MPKHATELLILTKTYPTPSHKYRETTCVAALSQAGSLLRLFPVPYRLLSDDVKFKKWEWIQASITRASTDNRPESHRIDVDTILITQKSVGTRHGWAERRRLLEPHIVDNFEALEARRQNSGQTLGFIRPNRVLQLDVTLVKESEWTEEDKIKLVQDGLFDSEEVKARAPLKKLPYDFHYVYTCSTSTGETTHRHKITDWEVGALFWNCYHSHGTNWEKPFRKRLETDFASRDLFFLMGTIHRFPDQWLIVGLVYPPKLKQDEGSQLTLKL